MDDLEQAAARDGQGRWTPGQSGNPAGKKPGTRNRATVLRERLEEDDVERAIEVLKDRLRAGDGVAARFVLDRIFPKPRDRAIDLDLASLEVEHIGPAELLDRVIRRTFAGEITIDEATRLSQLVHRRYTQWITEKERTAALAQPGARAVAARLAGCPATPASDLQTAGEHAAAPSAPPAPSSPPCPLNRHERRRAAALQRAAARATRPIATAA